MLLGGRYRSPRDTCFPPMPQEPAAAGRYRQVLQRLRVEPREGERDERGCDDLVGRPGRGVVRLRLVAPAAGPDDPTGPADRGRARVRRAWLRRGLALGHPRRLRADQGRPVLPLPLQAAARHRPHGRGRRVLGRGAQDDRGARARPDADAPRRDRRLRRPVDPRRRRAGRVPGDGRGRGVRRPATRLVRPLGAEHGRAPAVRARAGPAAPRDPTGPGEPTRGRGRLRPLRVRRDDRRLALLLRAHDRHLARDPARSSPPSRGSPSSATRDGSTAPLPIPRPSPGSAAPE